MSEACYVDFCLVHDTHLQSSCPWWAALRAQELFWEVPLSGPAACKAALESLVKWV